MLQIISSFYKRYITGTEIIFSGNPNAPRLLIFVDEINATYYISLHIPLKKLYEEGRLNFAVFSRVSINNNKNVSFLFKINSYWAPSLVIMSRYALPFGAEILDFFKRESIPVIYHIDDNLLEIPDSLGEQVKKNQGARDVIESRRYLLENCDLIYASTKYLKSVLQKQFPKNFFYSGIYASLMAGFSPLKKSHSGMTIGYMGSKSHQQDLGLVENDLERLMIDIPNLRFEVFGTIQMPTKLLKFGNRVRSHKVRRTYYEFIEYLYKLNWMIGLAPLEDIEFNRCKAPTKYVEYTSVHLPVIASPVTPYLEINNNSILYANGEDWYSPIKILIEEQNKRCLLSQNAYEYCESRYSIDILSQQILHLLELSKDNFLSFRGYKI